MPLRFIRVPRVNTQDVLHLATSATALTRELSSISCFPPAVAAVSIVLLIFETIQASVHFNLSGLWLVIDEYPCGSKSVQNNKEGCFRLARRCARILLDINLQMEGRWDSAPSNLLKNLEKFQVTLTSIHEFMKIQCDAKWSRRFMQKASIENALMDLTAQINDAAQSFQIAALIDIHYAVSNRPSGGQKSVDKADSPTITPPSSPPLMSPPPPYLIITETTQASSDSYAMASPTEMDHNDRNSYKQGRSGLTEVMEEGDISEEIISESALELEHHGFRRYHQSEVRLKGKSRLRGGWWEGASAVEVNGQSSLIKRYEGIHAEATKHWLNDVRILQNLHHPNLPQMVGFSAEGAPTPFILLSNVQTRTPQALLLDTVVNHGLAPSVALLLHFYQDVTDAMSYVQRQLGIEGNKAQDFIDEASYRIDASNSIVMGLPHRRGRWVTVRNYNLTESLTGVVMGMLPRGNLIEYKRIDRLDEDETRRKITHLVTLARGLLPTENDPPELSPRVKALLPGEDDEVDTRSGHPKLTLRQVRLSNIEAKTHNHAWNENACVPAYKFSVGDFGYIPPGKDFNEFVTLGNIFTDELASFPVENRASGSQWCWKDVPVRRTDLTPYILPGDVKGWAIAVPHGAQMDCQIIQSRIVANISDAWRFVLDNCQFLADEFDVKPDDLMFITCSGTDQHNYIRDFRSGFQHTGFQHPIHKPFMHNQQGFGHNQAINPHHRLLGRFDQQNSVPTVMYLMTSLDPEYDSYWTHDPVAAPKGAIPPSLRNGWTYQIGWSTGFINWIQLHAEDFLD